MSVDCTAGESINDALAQPAVELTVLVSGICTEDVVISRDRVSLLGGDPVADGIRAASTGTEPALLILDADFVLVDSISLGAGSNGVLVSEGRQEIRLNGVEISGNAEEELRVEDATVRLTGSAVVDADPTSAAVDVRDGGRLACSGATTVTATGLNASAVQVSNGGYATIVNCTVTSSGTGIGIGGAASALVQNSTITGDNVAIFTSVASDVRVFSSDLIGTMANSGSIEMFQGARGLVQDSTLQGRIFLEASRLRISGAQQTANGLGNQFTADSHLESTVGFLGGSTLVGQSAFSGFSTGNFDDASLGDLACFDGGNAVCDAGTTKTSSSCGLCP